VLHFIEREGERERREREIKRATGNISKGVGGIPEGKRDEELYRA